MKIITKELDKLLEREGKKVQHDIKTGTTQSPLMVVGHLFHQFSNWDWYLIGYSIEGNKDYVFSITKGFEVEYGDNFLPDLLEIKINGLPIERDMYFKPVEAKELYKKLKEER